MTKTVCDICGKEMSTETFVKSIKDYNFCMSSHGKIWDVCTECRVSLNRWMTIRRNKDCTTCANGIPLDKIRDEIEQTRKMYLDMNDIDWLNGCDYVLSVIDKYKAESEV